jgi:hypothetical protein
MIIAGGAVATGLLQTGRKAFAMIPIPPILLNSGDTLIMTSGSEWDMTNKYYLTDEPYH